MIKLEINNKQETKQVMVLIQIQSVSLGYATSVSQRRPLYFIFLKVKPLVMHASCCTICWATSDKVGIMDKSGAVSYYPDSPEEIYFVAVYKS